MDSVVLESVTKVFRTRPSLFRRSAARAENQALALDDVSLRIPAGAVLALLGPNGSGKTTTLKLIATTLLPDRGSIQVLGMDAQRQASAVRGQVGLAVAAERSFFPRLSARENLEFFAALDNVPRPLRRQRVEQMLAQTGLEEVAGELVMKFSSGMYQRLGIARALVKQPSVVLFDEPTRSLDPGSAARFCSLVLELAGGVTVVMATHNFEDAVALAQVVVVLLRGKVAAVREIRAGESVEDLRRFYLRTTHELEEIPEPRLRSAI